MPKFILTLLLIFTTSFSWSQNSQQEKLEKRKAEIQKEIREKEEMLKKVRKEEKTVSNQLAIQNEKITLKQKLINTTSHQTKLLGDDIYSNQLKINRLRKDLEILKQDYTQMVVKAYKSRSTQSRAMFLLSSENFQQAYKRFQYMKQYASYRKMQGDEIKYKTESLTGYTEKIVVQKIEKEKLLQANEAEKKILEKEKLVQQEIAKAIKKSKAQITAEIKKKQQESRRIDGQINKLIRDAIASANKKVAAANVKTNPKTTAATTKATETSTKIVLTPEAKLVADNFKSNKGRLPWPVEKGFVSLAYGDQPHPVYNTLIVHNSGVEISTDQGSLARAVFGGEVISVMVLSPVNKAVMIQHGDYFTVYQNLSSVNVSKGDKVQTKQTLGKIRTNGDSGKTVLKFMISQNTTYNNPASWLSNM
ncbi:murein hydrolase activator EnvC family protein [Flavobacterium sp.]|jgi:septal ring factor EnvC (AmiA/AmiB activator)|uniref:murein hydrolase activator EnvC family protein n=1 Tax=Flavobacterium sp. TaxID=239 RepID=UPI0037BEE232